MFIFVLFKQTIDTMFLLRLPDRSRNLRNQVNSANKAYFHVLEGESHVAPGKHGVQWMCIM